MEVAAQAESGLCANALLQVREQFREVRSIVEVTVVSMRRCDHVIDAILRRHPAHGFGGLPGLWAVVDLRQDVAVNVYHVERI
jgi:hypothetical protein